MSEAVSVDAGASWSSTKLRRAMLRTLVHFHAPRNAVACKMEVDESVPRREAVFASPPLRIHAAVIDQINRVTLVRRGARHGLESLLGDVRKLVVPPQCVRCGLLHACSAFAVHKAAGNHLVHVDTGAIWLPRAVATRVTARSRAQRGA